MNHKTFLNSWLFQDRNKTIASFHSLSTIQRKQDLASVATSTIKHKQKVADITWLYVWIAIYIQQQLS